jgi:hypothetical protein
MTFANYPKENSKGGIVDEKNSFIIISNIYYNNYGIKSFCTRKEYNYTGLMHLM